MEKAMEKKFLTILTFYITLSFSFISKAVDPYEKARLYKNLRNNTSLVLRRTDKNLLGENDPKGETKKMARALRKRIRDLEARKEQRSSKDEDDLESAKAALVYYQQKLEEQRLEAQSLKEKKGQVTSDKQRILDIMKAYKIYSNLSKALGNPNIDERTALTFLVQLERQAKLIKDKVKIGVYIIKPQDGKSDPYSRKMESVDMVLEPENPYVKLFKAIALPFELKNGEKVSLSLYGRRWQSDAAPGEYFPCVGRSFGGRPQPCKVDDIKNKFLRKVIRTGYEEG